MTPEESLHSSNRIQLVELVLAAQQGDREAQTALYNQYYHSCISTAWVLLGNHHDAEELVQEVFMHAFAKLGQLQVAAAFGGWLHRIVHRMAYNYRARRAPAYAMDPDLIEPLRWSETTPLDILLAEEQRAQVTLGLQKLGALDRATLEAYHLGEQSIAELSASFGAPLGTIKRRLHHARKRLARELEPPLAI